MTDKPIIIDGIDVSGCTYIIPPHKQCPNKPMPYAKETSCIACKEHNTKLNFCKNNPNCYYKQLKRKEQEVQQAMDNYVQLDLQRVKEYNELVDLYKSKEQECEDLKHKVELMMDCASCKIDEYKQTLAEIKEIAEEQCNICEELTPIDEYKDCKKCWQGVILQKISEVVE